MLVSLVCLLVMKSKLSDDEFIIIGDLNAKIGVDSTGIVYWQRLPIMENCSRV